MGFWATVSNEMPEAEWIAQFNQMLDSIPDSTLLTLLDCYV